MYGRGRGKLAEEFPVGRHNDVGGFFDIMDHQVTDGSIALAQERAVGDPGQAAFAAAVKR